MLGTFEPSRHDLCNLRRAAALLTAGVVLATLGLGTAAAQNNPTIGSPNTVTAAPGVPRPATTPCTVALFTNQQFADFNPKPFTYTPPAGCPAPWGRVVLEVDLSIDPGVQFDRTAQISLGNVNIYYGTTAEPYSNFGPSWHVERDVTDYSALFATPQSGNANLGNLVNSTYTSVLTGSATLQFYPPDAATPAPRTADVVMSLSDQPGGAAQLTTGSDVLAPPLTLPTNIERAYLDVIAQSQMDDEFWYTCVPDSAAKQLESCGGTAFREVEVTVDGKPAGVAPVRPWIFTGGIDPELWAPLPGIQTLNFAPFRVDLTPFAGLLSDGKVLHQVGISVFNADDYFLVSGTLLLFLDAGSPVVTGAVTRDTLAAAPKPFIKQTISQKHDGSIAASVITTSARDFTISGYVNTSHGKVVTTVNEQVAFANRQTFSISSSAFVQDITQTSDVSVETRTQDGSSAAVASRHFTYPLLMDINFVVNSDGTADQTTVVSQTFANHGSSAGTGVPAASDSIAQTEHSRDTLLISASGNLVGFKNRSSSQSFFEEATDGLCYSRALASSAGKLTAIETGAGCPGGKNSF